MRTLKLFILSVLIAFFCGCKENGSFIGKSRYDVKFSQEYLFPSGEPLCEVYGGGNLHLIDTLLLIEHIYENPSHHWDVYNVNDMKHLRSILRHGRGPNEVLLTHYAGQYERIDGDIWMFFMDPATDRFLRVNLSESIRSGYDVVELVTSIDYVNAPFFKIDDDTYLYCQQNNNEGYTSLMIGDNSWKNPVMEKKVYQGVETGNLYKLGNSFFYNQANNKVCAFPLYVNHFQIVDLEGNNDLIISTADSDDWRLIEQRDFEDLSVFYSSKRITDDYIFALYFNKKISEWDKVVEESEIHIFNWSGEGVARLRFKNNIVTFAVDMKNKVLYALNNLEQLTAYDISPYI